MLRGIYSVIYGEVHILVSICVEMKGEYTEKEQSYFISFTLRSWSGRKLLDPPSYLTTLRNTATYEGWNFNSGNYLFTTDTK